MRSKIRFNIYSYEHHPVTDADIVLLEFAKRNKKYHSNNFTKFLVKKQNPY